MRRRGVPSVLAAVFVIGLVSAGSTQPSLAGKQITLAGWGGALQQAMEKVWVEPFAKLTSLKINTDSPVSTAKIRLQVESGNVTWDVVESEAWLVTTRCGSLYERIDNAAVDVSKIERRFLVNDCGVPVVVWSWILVYDKSKFGANPPTGWADFFDTVKYPGKRGVWDTANGPIEVALLGDGVPPEKLYPLDLDRAFAKLDTIRKDLVFATTAAQSTEHLVSGRVVMAITNTESGYAAAKAGANTAPIFSQSIRSWDVLAILKGSKNIEAAQAFLNYVAKPEVQGRLSELAPVGWTTIDTVPKLDPLVRSYLPTSPENLRQGFDRNQKWYGENRDAMTQRWRAWVAG